MADMRELFPENVRALLSAFAKPEREGPLRQAAAHRAAKLAGFEGAAGEAGALPDDLGAYADQVALQAHAVTEADLAALKAAGHSEDRIYQVTVGAALGAGLARMAAGLTALSRWGRERPQTPPQTPGSEGAPRKAR
jgi:hypothetical protein